MIDHTNFIVTIGRHRAREMYYWLATSLTLTIITFGCISYYSWQQLQEKKELLRYQSSLSHLQKKEHETLCAQKACAEEYAQLQDRIKILDQWQASKEYPYTIANAIEKAITPNLSLQRLCIVNNTTELTLSASNAKELLAWAHTLSASSWGKKFRLVGMNRSGDTSIGVFKAVK